MIAKEEEAAEQDVLYELHAGSGRGAPAKFHIKRDTTDAGAGPDSAKGR